MEMAQRASHESLQQSVDLRVEIPLGGAASVCDSGGIGLSVVGRLALSIEEGKEPVRVHSGIYIKGIPETGAAYRVCLSGGVRRKKFRRVQGYGRPRSGSGGRSPPPPGTGEFSNICKKFHKNIPKNALF